MVLQSSDGLGTDLLLPKGTRDEGALVWCGAPRRQRTTRPTKARSLRQLSFVIGDKGPRSKWPLQSLQIA